MTSTVGICVSFIVFLSGQSYAGQMAREKLKFLKYVSQGESSQLGGDFLAAMNSYGRALKISRELNLVAKESLCLYKIGILAWNLGQIEKSRDSFSKILFNEPNGSVYQERCSYALRIIDSYLHGKDMRRSNRLEESIRSLSEAIELARAGKLKDLQLKCLRQISLSYWDAQEYSDFLRHNREALKIAQEISHKIEIGRCFNNIGLYYLKIGEFLSAVRNLDEARNIFDLCGEQEGKAECLTNLGIAYSEVGDYKQALEDFSEALRLDQDQGAGNSIFKDLINMASLHLKCGLCNNDKQEFRLGLEFLDRCHLASIESVDNRDVIAFLCNKGIAYYGLGEYDEALNLYSKALERVDTKIAKPISSSIYINMGDAYLRIGKFSLAKRAFENSISLDSESNSDIENWAALFGLGQCYENEGLLILALVFYSRSIEAIERIRSEIDFELFKIGFVRNKMEVYERALELLLKLYSRRPSETVADRIFALVEKAKARALLDNLSLSTESSKWGQEYFGELSDDYATASLKPKKEKSARLRPWRIAPEVCTADLAKQQLLDQGYAILQYWLGDRASFLVYMTRSRTRIFQLKEKSKIEQSVRGFIKAIESTPSDVLPNRYGAARRIAEEIMPVRDEDFMLNINRLLVIPDGILCYLPFEALMIKAGDSSSYLIERYEISYSPSASTLLALQNRSSPARPSKNLLAFGVSESVQSAERAVKQKGKDKSRQELPHFEKQQLKPLSYSTKEVLSIASHFVQQTTEVYIGEDANEKVVKSLDLKEYRVIHFACHGIIEEGLPFRAALFLSSEGSSSEDGILQAREIRDLEISAALVVLSACQTARGALIRAEGLFGLPWILFSAGARSVVSSLWEVNDQATAILMDEFYKCLSAGKTKISALRIAKMKMLRTSFAHPFYWASFVLSGDPSSLCLGES